MAQMIFLGEHSGCCTGQAVSALDRVTLAQAPVNGVV